MAKKYRACTAQGNGKPQQSAAGGVDFCCRHRPHRGRHPRVDAECSQENRAKTATQRELNNDRRHNERRDGLENAEVFDGTVAAVKKPVRRVIRPGPVKDLLHGVPTGHPLHPLAVQLPIGAWTSAVLLDCVPGAGTASRVLIAVGLVSAAPAVLSGLADWLELRPQHQRVGLVHSAANATGTLLFGTSLALRCTNRNKAGTIASAAALAVVAVGGTLGGQLAYHLAAGANHAESVPHRLSPGWHAVDELANMAPGKLEKRRVGEVAVLVWRSADGQASILSNECSHLSGPLSDGEVIAVKGVSCVECPWHQSRFSLATGQVMGGAATSPQAVFETRIVGGCLKPASHTPGSRARFQHLPARMGGVLSRGNSRGNNSGHQQPRMS